MRVTYKVILAVVFAMITAITYSLNILALAPDFPLAWIALVSFVIFATIVLWSWINTELQLKQLKETRPLIIVEPFGCNLRVRNLGASAKFTAQITIKGSEETWKFPLAGYWQKTKSNETEIMKGDYDNILIAKIENKNINLFQYDFDIQSLVNISTIEDNGILKPLPSEIEIDIQIISKPEMAKQILYTYKLDLNGLHYVDKYIFSNNLNK